ncbi:MAG: gliding motility-associated C-terminal domain-containing protein [Bacteroidales bacterium]|jgi:gliding motility-associated-like protein|nr:gliding motility-associated C-terminal domain-containing protein [Bacteroidales bacterium]
MKSFLRIVAFIALFGSVSFVCNASNLPDTTNNTKSCSVTIRNDTTITTLDSVVTVSLTAPLGAFSYLWQASNSSAVIANPSSRNTTATITDTTTFTLTATYIEPANLVVNGDFESGNTGFTTQLSYNPSTYGNGGLWGEGTYCVDYNAGDHHANFNTCYHTGNGKYFMANGVTSPNYTVWQQTITTQVGSTYLFSTDCVNIAPSTDPSKLSRFQFSVNNNLLGSIFTVTPGPCDWQTFNSSFVATTGSAVIKIVNQNTQQDGNDFGLDNIYVKKLCVATASVTFNIVRPCNVYAVDLAVTKDSLCRGEEIKLWNQSSSTGTSHWLYGNDSIIADTLLLMPQNSQTVTLILTDSNGCEATDSAFLYVEEPPVVTISGDTTICQHSFTTLSANVVPLSSDYVFAWSNGSSAQSINVDTTAEISITVTSPLGCTGNAQCNVTMNPLFYDTLSITLCEGEFYTEHGFNANATGTYQRDYISIDGCDSSYYLNLVVNPTYIDTIYDSICQYDSYEFHGNEYQEQGQYIANLQSINGCDSIFVLELTLKQVYRDTIKADIFKGKTFNLYGFSESETGIYTNTFEGSNGCDSTVVLDLQVDNIGFPNVVTANDDGINDVFVIHNLLEDNIFTENELIIYNRYGKEVYYKKNISKYDDFWKPDSSTPTGTYFYRFIGYRHDQTINHSGTIDVLR